MVWSKIKDGIAWRVRPLTNYLKRYKQVFIVQNYHRIFSGELNTEFDEGVFGGISQDYLYRQLKWLSKDYDIISEDDLVFCISNNSFPRKSLLLTFDDGYIDNYTLAYPLLLSLKMSAIFFISTKQFMERTLGWWDIISYSIKNTSKVKLSIDGNDFDLKGLPGRTAAIKKLLDKFYKMPASETFDLLEKLSLELSVDLPSHDIQSRELMDKNNLKDMIENGMFIGSHSNSHLVLSTLDYEEQDREVYVPKKVLESELGINVRSFAYPVGTSYSFDDKTKEMVRNHGYSFGFSFYSGVNDSKDIDPYDIKRTFRGLPYEGFLESFQNPYVFIKPKIT